MPRSACPRELTLSGGRRIAVYRPPGEPPAEGFATLVGLDGWLARKVLRIVGDREEQPGPGGTPSLLEMNRRMRDVLTSGGYPVTYREYHGGHDYVNWRNTFADAVLAVLSRG